MTQQIRIEPMAGLIGAEVHGADLREPLDEATFAAVHQALLGHLVIFFRDQAITPAQQVAFGRRFGELHIHPYIPSLPEQPEVIQLKSKADGPGNMAYQSNTWHTDLTYEAEPPKASILRAVQVPDAGGDTLWLNLCAAYEALSPPLREFVTGLTAIHNIVTSMPEDFLDQEWAASQLQRMRQTSPAVAHPVVRTHPETGRRCLFVNRNFTSHIQGFTRRESDRLLALLFEHIQHPEFQVRFRWRANSIAMWDNRCTQHRALVDYRSQRIMHRVTVAGGPEDRPRLV